jgi:protein-S-isoprenylcysteine O-methyltransferase Ste14
MVEPWVLTFFPLVFLTVVFGGGALFRRRNIDQGGEPPIEHTVFALSKYSLILLWGATVLHGWGVNLAVIQGPEALRWAALGLWALGFILLFIGRFGLGSAFRIGSARENTDLRVDGLFRFSRNPMYLGVYTTILAAVLYTLNPIVLLVGTFVVAVHHRIVLAEEAHLRGALGAAYTNYCQRVRRYL